MKVLAIGDVVADSGCRYLAEKLFQLKRKYGADIVIVNAENSARGNGVTPKSAQAVFDAGADVITLGNHALRRPEIYDYLEETAGIIRPANYHKSAPGKGFVILDKGAYRAAVINLQGTAFMENLENPFDKADEILNALQAEGVSVILVDFHAEATGEKKAMGFYLDGRASAVFGTHTHIQTADEQLLPNGTGYITDLGMTGPYYSVLGVKPEIIIQKLRTNLPVRFENAEGPCVLEGCYFEVDHKTGKTVAIERFRV